MRFVICAALFFFVLSGSWLRAQSPVSIGADDTTVVPGQRVGPITQYSSLSILRALYGVRNVKPKMQPLPSGDTTPGARLFDGSDRQLDILWEEGGREKRISEIRITGKAWTLANGLRTGLGVPEVEKINGKSIRLNGYGWDFTGFEGGALATGLGVRFFPASSGVSVRRPSDKKDRLPPGAEIRAVSPLVTQIVVWLR